MIARMLISPKHAPVRSPQVPGAPPEKAFTQQSSTPKPIAEAGLRPSLPQINKIAVVGGLIHLPPGYGLFVVVEFLECRKGHTELVPV